MTANAILAAGTLGHLYGLGVEEFVICAGARNAPLVTTLLRGASEKGCEVWSHFDERTAAFFAMGLTRRSGRPVAVITTSGTAVAELLPSVIESYYSGVPIVLVTADRPVIFRGSGAPQAIEQAGLFGIYAPTTLDIVGVEDFAPVVTWDRKSPLHLNVCFEEPRAEDAAESWSEIAIPLLESECVSSPGDELKAFCEDANRPLVLLGNLDQLWRPAVTRLLKSCGFPFWAEGTSGLREISELEETRIASESGITSLAPDAVIRIGGIPSCRFWRDLENLPDVSVLSVSPLPFTGLARESDLLVRDSFPEIKIETQPCWVRALTLIGPSGVRQLDAALDRTQDTSQNAESSALAESTKVSPASGDQTPLDPKRCEATSLHEPAVVRKLSEAIPSEALVFLGNSMPIREWNLAASFDVPHSCCFASRGANGIDGQIATFLGLSQGRAESWGIFGDLTALYDLNSPALLRAESGEKKRIVILNNGGGRIFSRLPSMADLPLAEKQRTENHHDRTFRSWAAMWDLEYVAWNPCDPFPKLDGEVVVIEVILNNEATEAFWASRK